jgi:Spore coat assembly protein
MKKIIKNTVVIIVVVTVVLYGCGMGKVSIGDQPVTVVSYAEEIDKNSIMTFEISVDEDSWLNMLDDALKEEYISADITINGYKISNVGIRPKGNSSLSSIAKDENTDRYSFKIKFDEYVEGQTWKGLDKIVLNSNYSDATSMKEYLSYDIMSYIGVNSPLFPTQIYQSMGKHGVSTWRLRTWTVVI